ncbi:hypothetical protein J437_LFUL009612, partial [Ladona fulva]
MASLSEDAIAKEVNRDDFSIVSGSSSDSEEDLISVPSSDSECEEEEISTSDLAGESGLQATWRPTLHYEEPRDFAGERGPKHDLDVVDNTNKYAEHCRNSENIDKDCVEVTYDEMVAYFGVLLYMGVFDLPESRDYWQSQEIDCPIIRNCMTFSRYCQITKYFQKSDISLEKYPKDEDYDVLQKVSPLLTFMDTFHHKYNPGRELVIGEAMVAFKGRHYIKQYMKGKPTKWGFKIWILASLYGYVLQGNVYLGKKEKRNKDMLLGSQVVINLLEKQLGLNHNVYYDSFFSSVGLMNTLYNNKTYACTTTRPTRKEWPTELNFPKKLKLKRGEIKSLPRGKVTATVWHDNRNICMLSTNCDPDSSISVSRKTGVGNKQIKIPCPQSVMLYTKSMGGVDRADQFRSYYGFGRTTKKWWKYLFAFVVNTAIMEEKKRVPTAAIRKDEHLRGDALKLHGNAEAVICLYEKWDVFLLIMKKKEWLSVTNNPIRFSAKRYRCGQDSNLRGQCPLDFKSNSLTTWTPQLDNNSLIFNPEFSFEKYIISSCSVLNSKFSFPCFDYK